MNATEVFTTFVTRTLSSARARRFSELASSSKGQLKLLQSLCHEFQPAIRDDVVHPRDYSMLWDMPCLVFHATVGFGVEFATVRAAYDHLALDDCWLIVLQDASAGIYRPEARWDDEQLLSWGSAGRLAKAEHRKAQ